ncbi:hypothetical protein [Variovorax sp.]|uniref:hypothetical protein n=1 Tax=Variovorax sp. TaxID=1871043 RepID=UPI002D5B7CAE|nr:hypothetical protein [Variovorax sp.]HYP84023.1 hypothetical protein [Variovorax sp.]
MNPNWNTPPGGDFVAYVERLTARTARQVFAPAPQRAAGFDGDADESPAAQALPAVRDDGEPQPMLSPGQLPPDKPFTRGLTAALGALRESLERSARNAKHPRKT